MATIRQIATRFTVAGLAQVRSATARFGSLVTSGARTAGNAVKSFATGSVKHIATVSKAIAGVSFKALMVGGKLAFGGISAAALGTVAKIGLVSAAAKKVTEEMAEYLRKLDTQAKTTGESVEDLATLRFAAEQNGGDPDELSATLGNIATSFGDIKKSIDEANEAYEKTGAWARKGIIAAARTGDIDMAQGFIDMSREARMGSLDGINRRRGAIGADIRATAPGGAEYKRALASGITASQAEAQMTRRRIALVQEFKDLNAAEEKIKGGFGPAGEAMEELKKVGLDMDAVLKGGTKSLYALGDALAKIPDSSKKLALAQQLFGEDAGAKNLALLEGASEAREKYRKEMESYGALPTKADAERGTALKRSEGRRGMALQGVKLEINRGLSPLMIEANDELAAFLARNRMTIAQAVQETFKVAASIFSDFLKVFEGKDNYESALFKKGAAALAWAKELYANVRAIAEVTAGEVGKILSGEDSDWGWLNKARDAFLWLKSLATDAFAVLTGSGEAVDFKWMNTAKAMFEDFMKSVREAWDMFKQVLNGIHAAVKPVLDFFGKDITTAVLFLAMLRFSGILKGIALLGRGLLGIFTPALAGIGAGAAAAATSAGLIGAAMVAAYVASQQLAGYLANKFVEGENKIQETIAATARIRDEQYLREKYAKLPDVKSRRNFYKNVLQGDLAQTQDERWMANYDAGRRGLEYAPGHVPTDQEKAISGLNYERLQKAAGKTYNLNLNLGGKTANLIGFGDDGGVVSEIERQVRLGGNY